MTTKGRYAVRILVALALAGKKSSAREMAAREDISASYVEQILSKLRSAGLVRSHRGVNGGFALARDPEDISVTDVLTAMEGPVQIIPCVGKRCDRSTACAVQTVWEKANDALLEIFTATTIANLADTARRSPTALSYEI